ncbi:MAG: prenyltransferase [Bdellovibrionales bacterium]|nr:prenyltransferase [Bdellovibrionales bacterium]
MKTQNQFVTLSKNNKDFTAYLTGSFSDQKRAIPIHSFSVNTPVEKVTFELKKLSEINRPSFVFLLLCLSRPRYWVFTLGPLMITLGLNYALGLPLNFYHVILSFISLILLNLSAFSLNDYFDHLAGVDRISQTSGSQVIQKAWLAASQVKNIAYICLFLTLLFSLPLFVAEPLVSIVMALFAAFALFAFSYKDLGLKYKGIGEFIVFLALGPLIVIGLSSVISSEVRIEHIGVGSCLGWIAMIHMQIKNWMHIMPNSKAGIKTFISRLGFDKAKLYLCFQLIILCVLSFGIYYLPISIEAASLFCGSVVGSSLFMIYKILKIYSPVSSQLKKVYKYAMNLNWFYCLIFAGVLFF